MKNAAGSGGVYMGPRIPFESGPHFLETCMTDASLAA
jgi:hypothetical protein